MKILLVGANGRLGRELLRSLRPHGAIVASVRPGANPPAEVETRPADVTCPEQLRDLLRGVRPDLVVNATAYTAVEAAERDRASAIALNATVPGVLAEEAAAIGAALVHYSTDYVFGSSSDRFSREDDPTGPLNVYGETKLAGEEAIRSTGADHLIIRACWLYQSQGPNFVKKMLDLAKEQPEISMPDDQVGSPTSMRFVADTTAGIVAQAAGRPAQIFQTCGGTLHVACGGAASWYEFTCEIFQAVRDLGLDTPVARVRPIATSSRPGAMKRPLNSRLDTSRLRQQFSIVPPRWQAEFRAVLPELFAQYQRERAAAAPRSPSVPLSAAKTL